MPHRRHIVLATAIALALAGFFTVNLFRAFNSATSVATRTAPLGFASINDISSGVPRRASYRYSVIAGGVSDAGELAAAVKRDPVVAEHYRDLNPATLRTETVKAERLAYVSYRIDDRVYWTKRKLRIRSGETVLTNGQIEIRARCGNCISLEPMLPTAANEPDESQFDALTDLGPTLVSWNLPASGIPLAVSSPPGDLETPVFGLAPLVPIVAFGVPLFPGGPITTPPTEGPIGSSPPVTLPDVPPGITAPPGGLVPPLGGGPPATGLPPGAQPELPLVLQPLLDNGANLATPSTTPESQLTPVPEPGTLLLFGSGVAGLLARRWRLKKT